MERKKDLPRSSRVGKSGEREGWDGWVNEGVSEEECRKGMAGMRSKKSRG